MSTREFVGQALGLLAPLVLALIAYAAARLTEQLRKRVRDARVRALLDAAARVVGIGVANAYQTVVADLKDPRKPGRWDEAAAKAVKSSVLADVRALIPRVLDELGRVGVGDVDRLLDRLVEAAVLELNRRAAVPLLIDAQLPEDAATPPARPSARWGRS